MNDIFKDLDLSALADLHDKVQECEFFLNLASYEKDRARFRWFVSAFLNAVYSYFETTSVQLHAAFTDFDSRDPIKDSEAIAKIKEYVQVKQSTTNPYFVKTKGTHPVIVLLYEIRKHAVHHSPLSIMESGKNLPEDFHLGSMRSKGIPLLALCREALGLVKELHHNLEQ